MSSSLEQFVETVSGTGHLRVEHDFGDGFVRLQTSEAERRQAAQDIRCTEDIVIELLRNSRDAHASHVFLAMSREGDRRILTIVDDGCGIPPAMHERVFEPRVTSKLDTSHMDAWGMHGRGMALYSIAVNATEARIVQSDVDRGCSMRIETNLRSLSEKTDQSSFPTFELGEGGKVNVRGPKNIVRNACEFAIESRNSCDVYVGSPAEICATLYAFGTSTLATIDRLFCSDEASIPVAKRLALTGDPKAFVETAASLGLEISERTARRILDGQIADLDPILDRIRITGPATSATKPRKAQKPTDARSFKLQKPDAQMLASTTKAAFADIAERYYLEENVDPQVRAKRDRITITIPVVKRP